MVVVGARLAGLCAARRLVSAGLHVVVVEAGGRAGRRGATDVVDGFLPDRGFQVDDTACPAAARVLDHPALDRRRFTRDGDRLHRVADARRRPIAAGRTLRAPIGSSADKAQLAAPAARAALLPVDRLLAAPGPPVGQPILVLDGGRRGPVAASVVLTEAKVPGRRPAQAVLREPRTAPGGGAVVA